MNANDKTIPGGKEQTTPKTPDNSLDTGANTPSPEKTDKEAAVLADGEHPPGPDGKVVPFDRITQKQGTDQADKDKTVPDAPAAKDKAPEQQKHGRPPKADKADKPPKAEKSAKTPDKPGNPEYEKALADYKDARAEWDSKEPWEKSAEPPKRPKPPKKEKEAAGGMEKTAAKAKLPAKVESPAPSGPEPPPPPREAPRRNGTEQIVYLNLSELQPFKDHPFGVRDDAEMKTLVESVKDGGVNQPALVRPIEGGGYEIVAGHRRHKVSAMEKHLSNIVTQLDAMNKALAEAQKMKHPLRNAMQKVVITLQAQALDIRDKLSTLKQNIIVGCKNALEAFQDKGLSALRDFTQFFKIQPGLGALRKDINKYIKLDEAQIASFEKMNARYHKAGMHLANTGRALVGKEALQDPKPMGKIAKAFIAPTRADLACLKAMNKCVGKAIDAVDRLKSIERKPPIMKTIEKHNNEIAEQAQRDAPQRVRPVRVER